MKNHRQLFRLTIQTRRRGIFMMHWQIEEIVERRLMRELFVHWLKERQA